MAWLKTENISKTIYISQEERILVLIFSVLDLQLFVKGIFLLVKPPTHTYYH